MDLLLFIARAVVAAIFLIAGVSKLFDREGTRKALENFGIPGALAPAGAALLPIAELVTTVALLPRVTAWWGALAALLLLMAFCVGIAVNLLRGQTPDCHCFGQLYSEPIGWSTLARNVVFALPAALVVFHGPENPGLDPFTTFGAMSSRDQLVTVVLVLSLIVLIFLLRVTVVLLEESPHSVWELLLHGHQEHGPAPSSTDPLVPGLPVTSAAPAFQLPSVDGREVTLEMLCARGRPVMLIFSSTTCSICSELMPDVAKWQQELDEYLTLAVVEQGDAATIREEAARYGLRNVLVERGDEVYTAYNAFGTPSGVVVQADGTIGSASASGPDELHGLLAQTLGLMMLSSLGLMPAPPPSGSQPLVGEEQLHVGDGVPSLSLRDIEGHPVDLKDLARPPISLLLWDSHRRACQELEDEVLAFEATGVPLAILLPGTVAGNQTIRFQSRILVDRNDTVRHVLGLRDAPSAVLLGNERVESEVAEGPGEVRHLLARFRAGRAAYVPTPVDG